ncbi:hypothetical protein [Roseivirga sp.]|uniref:hypothetical protein n=1 Tax=Roseivirga sp. TaxID=1964215 RepID=UPI003B8C091E
MNYLKAVLISTLIYSTQLTNAQTFKADIQYVTIEDTLLIQSIKSILTLESKNDTLFAKGFGYLNVGIDWMVSEGSGIGSARIDTVRTYNISVSFAHPNKTHNNLMPFYPKYYSIIDERVVAFELPERHIKFSANSVKVYEQIIEKYLEPFGSPSTRLLWKLDYNYRVNILQNQFNSDYEDPIISKISLTQK